MKPTQFILFTVGATLLNFGCAKTSEETADTAPRVDESAYQGAPGEFAALYTGECAIQTSTHLYNSCSTRIRIRHRGNQLLINTRFLLNPSSRIANEPALVGHDAIVVIQDGNRLLQPTTGEVLGVIGERGFQIQKQGAPYHFARLFPNAYEYSGAFTIDGTGEVVSVTARLKRGAALSEPVQPPNLRRTHH